MRTGIVAVLLGAWVTAASRTEAQEFAGAGLAGEPGAILKNACYRCHGEDGTVEGGFSYVLDRGQLVSCKQIVPGAAAQSKLICRVRSGEMPPERESPQLTKEQMNCSHAGSTAAPGGFSRRKLTKAKCCCNSRR